MGKRICFVNVGVKNSSVPKIFGFLNYGLAVIKEVTPKNYKTCVVNYSNLGKLPDAEIYAFSVFVLNLKLCCVLGKKLLKQGKCVIFGGPSVNSENISLYNCCSSIVEGEAEEMWPKILGDYEKGLLKKMYKCEPCDMKNFPIINRENLPFFQFNNLILTTRGCRYNCAYCDSTKNGKIRHRPLSHVIKELELINKYSRGPFKRLLFFLDLNIVNDKEYSKELFKAMQRFNFRWFSNSSIQIAEDDELLDLAYKSGCRGLAIGYETIEKENLRYIKPQNYHIDYGLATKKIKNKRIMVQGYFIFGFDYDTKKTFKKTLEFCDTYKLDNAQFSILVPLSNTKVRELLIKDLRISNLFEFIPKNFSYLYLKDNTYKVIVKYYSLYRILKRSINLPTNGKWLYNLLVIILLFHLKLYYSKYTSVAHKLKFKNINSSLNK